MEGGSGEVEATQQLILSNHTSTSSTTAIGNADTTYTSDSYYLPHEKSAEGTTLFLTATTGILLNIFIFIMILYSKELRRYTNGFTAHGCILDAFKVRVLS